MKVEEFRIGNLAIDFFAKSNGFEDYIVVISSLSDTGEIRSRTFNKNKGQASILREMLVGIPLTDEWLVNFGFYKSGLNVWRKQLSNGNNYVVHTTEVVYVHTLQNHFYTMTGEELTLI